jgi:steroid delta-isomerase-like uncharacterized protein
MVDAMNRGDFAAAEVYVAPNAVNYTPVPGEPPGLEGFRYRMGMMHGAFPDLHFNIDDQVAEGDKVVTRGTMTATNTGSFMGMPSTGKAVQVSYIDILRFTEGKLFEHWVQMDMLGMMQQLGVVPAPG